jgi:preprotein translocase subunit SecB
MGSVAGLQAVVDPTRPPGLTIAQIFLVHAHFEHRADPITISPVVEEEARLTVNFRARELTQEDGRDAVEVTVTAATHPESSHPYVFDFSISAIIHAEVGHENFPAAQYAVSAGAPLLFPFLREAIANVTGRGRCGPLWIKPFNIQHALQQQQSEAGPAPTLAEP